MNALEFTARLDAWLKALAERPLPPAPTLPTNTFLTPGMRGTEVRQLQRCLRAAGYQLNISGIFDRITENCLKSFQATHALPRTGEVNAATWMTLGGEAYAA